MLWLSSRRKSGSMLERVLVWAIRMTLEVSPGTEASSVSVVIACTWAGGFLLGQTKEVCPSSPHERQRTLEGFFGDVRTEPPLLDEESSVEPEVPDFFFASCANFQSFEYCMRVCVCCNLANFRAVWSHVCVAATCVPDHDHFWDRTGARLVGHFWWGVSFPLVVL